MKNKRSFLQLSLLILLTFLSACAFRLDESMDGSSQIDRVIEMEESAIDELADLENEEIGLDLGEKIIESASLNYETIHFNNTVDFITQKIAAYEGHLENSIRGQSSSTYEFVGEYISMTIRLPNESLDPFINDLSAYDDLFLQNEEINREDVTKVFRDNETRLAVLKEEEEALRKMLQEQGSLEEILQIRTRLSEVISEREIYENENQYYNDQSEFSTIYLYVQQADRAKNRDLSGFWNRFSNALIDSFYRFVAVTQNIAIAAVYLIPYLIIILLFTTVFYVIFKFIKKKK